MDGLLLFNKPIFWTSHDAVDFIRRVAGQRAVGHAGTLDPMATGLLLILLGSTTKKSEELMGLGKGYEGTILFGTGTDTQDLDGKILSEESAAFLTGKSIETAMASFLGTTMQEPPAFSAIKIGGQKSYEMARKGVILARKPREVRIDQFDCLWHSGEEIYFSLSCSKGTYVRSLAADLGKKLGVCATLSSLVRTRIGQYDLKNALTQARVVELGIAGIQSELTFEGVSGDCRV